MNIEQIVAGNIKGWQGLSAQETIITLSRALEPLRHVNAPVENIRTTQRFQVVVFERSSPPHFMEAWFLFGEGHVALLEYDYPLVDDLPGTLQEFGEPDLLLSNKRFIAGAVVSEYVYARRGITLSIAEPLVGVTGGVTGVVHLQLYPATSAQYYITRIGTGPEFHPYPRTL